MYVIIITTTHWDGYGVKSVFVTKDKSKAESWVNRFNKIVENRRDWINKFEKSEVAVGSMYEPFCYDYVTHKDPEASFHTIAVR